MLLLAKLQTSAWNFTKSNTPPWVFFTFFKSYTWYQIVQSLTYYLHWITSIDHIAWLFRMRTISLHNMLWWQKFEKQEDFVALIQLKESWLIPLTSDGLWLPNLDNTKTLCTHLIDHSIEDFHDTTLKELLCLETKLSNLDNKKTGITRFDEVLCNTSWWNQMRSCWLSKTYFYSFPIWNSTAR